MSFLGWLGVEGLKSRIYARPGSNLGIKRVPCFLVLRGLIREPQPYEKGKKGILPVLV